MIMCATAGIRSAILKCHKKYSAYSLRQYASSYYSYYCNSQKISKTEYDIYLDFELSLLRFYKSYVEKYL